MVFLTAGATLPPSHPPNTSKTSAKRHSSSFLPAYSTQMGRALLERILRRTWQQELLAMEHACFELAERCGDRLAREAYLSMAANYRAAATKAPRAKVFGAS